MKAKRKKKERACRVCGCTDEKACPGGCSWVERDLCSACAMTAAELIECVEYEIKTLHDSYFEPVHGCVVDAEIVHAIECLRQVVGWLRLLARCSVKTD